jgi:hypothetical protein
MSETDHPGKTGLLAGAEVVKYLTALGTGAIVFSAGLLSDKLFLPTAAKWLMALSWLVLSLSIFAGVVAAMRIPIQLTEENYNLEDKWLKYPGLVQQFAFLLGIVLLGIALATILIEHGKVHPQEAKTSFAEPTKKSSPVVPK